MRIIAGEAKGRTLFAPPGDQTRPTSDKTRGSLFNILLPHIRDARVLDLFGGTGALALEALSRGASFAAIADISGQAIRVIERNAENVLKDEMPVRVKILKADYRTAISLLSAPPYDLVFLDPPYRMIDAYADALTRLHGAGMLSEAVIIVSERLKEADVPFPDEFEKYDTRVYRDTAVDFLRYRRSGAER